MQHRRWTIPLLFMVALTPFTPWIDRSISSYVFNHEWLTEKTPDDVGFFTSPFFTFMYYWGVLPAQAAGVISTLFVIVCLLFKKRSHLQLAAWVLALNLIIGSGLITHMALKESWGRPRPRQVVEFGGKQEFRPYYKPQFMNAPETSRSMPSGHSSTGFYFLCLYPLFMRYRKPKLAYLGLGFAVVLGTVLSVTRIIQGGHFFSDVLVAALIMWCTACFVDYLVFESRLFDSARRSANTSRAAL